MSVDRSVSAAVERALREQGGDALVDAAMAVTTPGTWDDLDASGDGPAWEYIAADQWVDEEGNVVSDEPCPVCAALHGRRFPGLQDLYAVLPNFGPNPACTATNCGCSALPTRG